MTDVPAAADEKKKFRSPPYPMFDLGKAIDRAKNLYSKAQGHSVGVNVLAEAWGMKSGDGKVWRAAAALIQYGLLTDSGTGKARKFQLSDTAKRIVLDLNPESQKRAEALRSSALAPMIHSELWEKFRSMQGLADSVVTSYLVLDREEQGESPYSQSAAEEVLKIYRASLSYAGLSDSDTVDRSSTVKEPDGKGAPNPPKPTNVKIGDLVKWSSGGVDQFDARKVSWISDDGSHLRVIGSNTGVPMTEVEKVTPTPASTQAPEVAPETGNNAKTGGGKLAKLQNVTTSVIGNRLQISADVNADEIEPLLTVLKKYQEILKLMN